MIHEIVSRVAHQSDAVEDEAADEFGRDDQGIQAQRKIETGTQMLKGGQVSHKHSVARSYVWLIRKISISSTLSVPSFHDPTAVKLDGIIHGVGREIGAVGPLHRAHGDAHLREHCGVA